MSVVAADPQRGDYLTDGERLVQVLDVARSGGSRMTILFCEDVRAPSDEPAPLLKVRADRVGGSKSLGRDKSWRRVVPSADA